MRPNAEHLFSRYDCYGLQEHQRQEMAEKIGQADPEVIRTGDVEELANRFAEQFFLEAPTLLPGALSITVEEHQVDVQGDFRFGAYGPDPNYVSGIRVCYYVPFFGEREMFGCAANARNLSLRPVEIGDHELQFAYERPDQEVGATKAEFDREISQIEETLGWLRNDCRTFNAALPAQAREKIVARKGRLAEMTQGIQSLGLPIRRAATSAPTGPAARVPPPSQKQAPKKTERYDIALSFAGENRAYVEEVATGLKAAGVSVFYDGFEKAKLWGKNLIDHLAEIYSNSRYVVMFVSKEYVAKAWTMLERKHAQDRALFAQEEYILPAKFDDTPVPGMTTTVAFQDLRTMPPGELVELILAKLHRT
jgi:TIR domain